MFQKRNARAVHTLSDASAPPNRSDRATICIHVDVDCFYAQVEEIRDPSLRTKPVGIVQKFLVVTCNYPARERGVTKLMAGKTLPLSRVSTAFVDLAKAVRCRAVIFPVAAAVKQCPELVLLSGEDLSPYRAKSKQILTILQRFGAFSQTPTYCC